MFISICTWWRHQIEILPALLVLGAGNSPVNSPHKGQRRGALVISLIGVWINDWVNNRQADDLRCHRLWHHCNEIASLVEHSAIPVKIHKDTVLNLDMFDSWLYKSELSQIAKFTGAPGSCRPQMGAMLAPWTLLSGVIIQSSTWRLDGV